MARGMCKAPWRRTNSRESFCCCCCIPALAVPAAARAGFFLVSFPHGGMGVGDFMFVACGELNVVRMREKKIGAYH